jgi:RHS repeat-associated protein
VGRVSEITYPSGRIVLVARDATGRVTGVTMKENASASVETVASGILFKPMSDLLSSLNHGNGLATTATYDQDYRLTSLALMDGAVALLSKSYAYGDGLNLTGITDNVTPANSNTLAYSATNRLVLASGAWGSNSFSYYGAGNRLMSLTENAAAFRSYTYDGAGNTLMETRPGESFAYAYNNRNRLVSVTRNGSSWASYGYNALEQLVTRSSSAPSAPSGTVHYLYDLDGHLMSEADGSTGAVLRDYIWLPANDNGNAAPGGAFSDDLAIAGAANDNTPPDLPLAVIDGVNTATPQTYQVHSDHLGRPVAMTDATKATVWSATWTPRGEAHSLTGSAVNNLRFPGQYFLIETGHAYNWHRTYDPVSGRYTQPDPLRFVDGSSVYAYAGNSPFMNTDREGLDDRYFAGNLREQLVMQDAMNGGGECIIDPTNFPAGGKKFRVSQNRIAVHYMCNCNGIRGDFKFKN